MERYGSFVVPTVTECLREHLLLSLGCHVDQRRLPDLPELIRIRWSPAFEWMMRRRLIIGAFRYGLFNEGSKWDQVSSIRRHLDLYEKTGNLEDLVDVANLALVEFVEGSHPNRHWKARDDSEHARLVE